MRSEAQSTSSRIWTRLTDSVSYDAAKFSAMQNDEKEKERNEI